MGNTRCLISSSYGLTSTFSSSFISCFFFFPLQWKITRNFCHSTYWWLNERLNIPFSHAQSSKWHLVITLIGSGLLQLLSRLKGLKWHLLTAHLRRIPNTYKGGNLYYMMWEPKQFSFHIESFKYILIVYFYESQSRFFYISREIFMQSIYLASPQSFMENGFTQCLLEERNNLCAISNISMSSSYRKRIMKPPSTYFFL